MTAPVRTTRYRAVTWPLAAATGAAIVLASCGSSSSKTAATSPPTTGAAAPTAAAGSSASNTAVTLSTAAVSGVGTVLVNGSGRTLYMLTAEQGGKVVCTASNACTKYWSPATLPSGMSTGIAGSGAQASLLGTIKDASGQSRLTYGGWPVYTFVGDSSSGVAKGQGVTSFGGTWWVINPAGMPVTSSSGGTTSTTTGSSGYGGGY